jgi:hypothetical protein
MRSRRRASPRSPACCTARRPRPSWTSARSWNSGSSSWGAGDAGRSAASCWGASPRASSTTRGSRYSWRATASGHPRGSSSATTAPRTPSAHDRRRLDEAAQREEEAADERADRLGRLLKGNPKVKVSEGNAAPNLLATGILTILISLAFLVWVTTFVHGRNGGQILILLSAVILLIGGGIGPPILGFILGGAAISTNAPSTRRHAHLSHGTRRFLAKLWPWSLVAGVVAWLAVLPGSVLLVLTLSLLSAFGFLLLTLIAALARDALEQTHRSRL